MNQLAKIVQYIERYEDRFTPQDQQLVEEIKKFCARQYQIAVVGRFSSGKSSFLNMLFQERLVATGWQPVTMNRIELCYGERLNYVFVQPRQRRILTEADAFALMEREQDGYLQIELPHPLLRYCRFVDTRGYGEEYYDDVTRVLEEIQEVDRVFLVVNYNQATPADTCRLVEQVKAVPLPLDCVVTGMDLLEESSDDIDEDWNDIEQSLRSIGIERVFPVSSVHRDDEISEYAQQERRAIRTLFAQINEEMERQIEQWRQQLRVLLERIGSEYAEKLERFPFVKLLKKMRNYEERCGQLAKLDEAIVQSRRALRQRFMAYNEERQRVIQLSVSEVEDYVKQSMLYQYDGETQQMVKDMVRYRELIAECIEQQQMTRTRYEYFEKLLTPAWLASGILTSRLLERYRVYQNSYERQIQLEQQVKQRVSLLEERLHHFFDRRQMESFVQDETLEAQRAKVDYQKRVKKLNNTSKRLRKELKDVLQALLDVECYFKEVLYICQFDCDYPRQLSWSAYFTEQEVYEEWNERASFVLRMQAKPMMKKWHKLPVYESTIPMYKMKEHERILPVALQSYDYTSLLWFNRFTSWAALAVVWIIGYQSFIGTAEQIGQLLMMYVESRIME